MSIGSYHLGLSLNELSQHEQALFHFDRAAQLKPKVTAYCFQLALILKETHRVQAAKQAFVNVLQMTDYSEAPILFEYSRFLEEIGEEQSAMAYVRMAEALALESDETKEGDGSAETPTTDRAKYQSEGRQDDMKEQH